MNNAAETLRAGRDRAYQSRAWIIAAFNRLVLGRGYETVSVGEVSRRAGVGRSTFYEHFRDKDEVLRHALEPILAPLADAAVARGDSRSVQHVLEHIAENQGRSLVMLEGAVRLQVEQALAELILTRLVSGRDGRDAAVLRLEAARLAGSHISVIRAWLKDAAGACPSSHVAGLLMEAGVRDAARSVGTGRE